MGAQALKALVGPAGAGRLTDFGELAALLKIKIPAQAPAARDVMVELLALAPLEAGGGGGVL